MGYTILLSPQPQKFLKKCERELRKRILKKLRYIKGSPRRYLDSLKRYDFLKFRIGDYRAMVDLQERSKKN